jgi:ubiquinone/menaquinone biosynthesis C-methylase UbiE
MRMIGSFLFAVLYFIVSLFQLVVLVLLSPKRIEKLYRRLDAKEEEKRIAAIRPFVSEGDTVLDVGAGSGRFGKAIHERLNVQVTGVDVCDYSDHTMPFFVYDGTTLPFPDKSFDVVFFAFVLHHTRNQEALIQEARRVARKRIVIFEDSYEFAFERLFTCWNDYHTNVFQGWIKARKGYLKGNPFEMPMPLTFRSLQGWGDLFKTIRLRITSQDVRRMGYKPLTKVTFSLQENH